MGWHFCLSAQLTELSKNARGNSKLRPPPILWFLQVRRDRKILEIMVRRISPRFILHEIVQGTDVKCFVMLRVLIMMIPSHFRAKCMSRYDLWSGIPFFNSSGLRWQLVRARLTRTEQLKSQESSKIYRLWCGFQTEARIKHAFYNNQRTLKEFWRLCDGSSLWKASKCE